MSLTNEKTVALDTGEAGEDAFEWLDGATNAADVLTIDFGNLSADYAPVTADCEEVTGDIREVVFGFLSHLYDIQEARAAASATDALAGMVVSKTELLTDRTDGNLKTVFQVEFIRTKGDKNSYPAAYPLKATDTSTHE